MAKKTLVEIQLVDDLDGGVAVETIPFAFDGTRYEIDLSKKNAAAMRKAFAGYVNSARKVPNRRKTASTANGSNAREIREWARSQGIEVPERGRIPAEVRAAYMAGH